MLRKKDSSCFNMCLHDRFHFIMMWPFLKQAKHKCPEHWSRHSLGAEGKRRKGGEGVGIITPAHPIWTRPRKLAVKDAYASQVESTFSRCINWASVNFNHNMGFCHYMPDWCSIKARHSCIAIHHIWETTNFLEQICSRKSIKGL